MMISFNCKALAKNSHTRAIACVLGSLGIAALVSPISAASITVPNASFESPTAPAQSGTPVLDDWQKTAEPAGFNPVNTGGFPWTTLSGVFDGGPTVPDGSQGAYLLTYPGVGIYQTLGATYQLGTSYNLTVGLHGGGGGLNPTDQLRMMFYYGGSLTPITTATIDYTALNFPDQSQYYDFELSLPTVQSGDAWAGQNIGIEFTAMNGTMSGSWDLDNVRLTAVPEPSTVLLLTLGLGCGVLFTRRQKIETSGSINAADRK
jgi:hypothetical protein